MKKAAALLLLLCICSLLRAQIAGMSTYAVLDIPSSARASGLGFDYLSIYDADVNLALNNPSLNSSRIDNQLSVSFVNMFAGSNFGAAAYSHTFKNIGSFTFGIQFDSYGRFKGYDETDTPTGSFSAADYVLSIGWGRAIDKNMSIGANFKPILSHYEHYTAFALGIDIAATYISTDKSFAATLMGRNIGSQVLAFDDTKESLPFEISIIGSYKLADAPFRLFFALNELQTWDLTYDDPINPSVTVDPFSGVVTKPTQFSSFADKVFRHLNVGVELSIKDNFYATLGYSYRQMVEMTAAETFNLSGFSFGFGVDVKGFKLAYARNNYHLVQAPNFISVTTSLERLFRK